MQGYSPWTAVSYLYSFARLSRWLAAQGLTAGDLDGVCVDRFVAARAERPRGCGAAGDPARDVLGAGLPATGGSGCWRWPASARMSSDR